MRKTAILTFDDGPRSHLDFVAPFLADLGFGATFFMTHAFMEDHDNYLDWEEIAEIDRMGFEIGNHTWSHRIFSRPENFPTFRDELLSVERALSDVGVGKPVSFAWPANCFSEELFPVLREMGYRRGRRGRLPEATEDSSEPGPVYGPDVHDRFAIPSTGIAYPDWNLEYFKRTVALAEPGKPVVLQFHGVPEVKFPQVDTPSEMFVSYMDHLRDEDFVVVAMREFDNGATA